MERYHYLLFFTFLTLSFPTFSEQTRGSTSKISKYFLVLTSCLFGTLLAFICSDLSNYSIFTNSNINTPFFYKLSSTWSNHEGSLLLWCWLLTLYGFFFNYHSNICKKTKARERSEAGLGKVPSDNCSYGQYPRGKEMLFKASRGRLKQLVKSVELSGLFFSVSKALTRVSDFLSPTGDRVGWQTKNRKSKTMREILIAVKGEATENLPTDSSSMFIKIPLHHFNLQSTKDWTFFLAQKFDLINKKRNRDLALQIFQFVVIFFVSFLLWTSNPFLKNHFPCINSLAELNPVLQDPVLAIHPPCIYAGYVASAITFSLCLAKIQERKKLCYLLPWIFSFSVPVAQSSLEEVKSKSKEHSVFRTYSNFLETSSRCIYPISTQSIKNKTFTPSLAIQDKAQVPPMKVLKNSLGSVPFYNNIAFFAEAKTSQNSKVSFCSERVAASSFTLGLKALETYNVPSAGKPSIRQWMRYNENLKEEDKKSIVFSLGTILPLFLLQKTSHYRETQPSYIYPLSRLETTFFEKDKTAYEVKQIQIWILLCWCFLTIGILLGSWWAYHELGWGGWWFWDPVENASLMPWLTATACIHSVTVQRLKNWTLVLNVLTFLLSILGTFFVRSGFLASVHSFAYDSTRGLYLAFFLILMLGISIYQFLKYFLSQAPYNTQEKPKFKSLLEFLLTIQNFFFFCTICLIVLNGTSLPLVYQWYLNRDVSTGAPFFNGTIIPLASSLLILLVYTHYKYVNHLSFRKTKAKAEIDFYLSIRRKFNLDSMDFLSSSKKTLKKSKASHYLWCKASHYLWCKASHYLFFFYLLFCVIIHIFFFYFFTKLSLLGSAYALICILLFSSFLLPDKISQFIEKTQHKALQASQLNSRTCTQPSRFLNYISASNKLKSTLKIAHAGFVFFLTGILLSNNYRVDVSQIQHVGSKFSYGSHIAYLRSIDQNHGPTFHSICGNFILSQEEFHNNFKSDYDISNALYDAFFLQNPQPMFPEKRFFFSNPVFFSENTVEFSQENTTTKVAIHTNFLTDFYTLIGTGSIETGWFTTLMKLPFIFCIWLGFFISAFGGMIALKKLFEKSKLKWV